MTKLIKTTVAAAAVAGVAAAPAAAAPAQCEVFDNPLQGGACVQWEKHEKLNGSAYNQSYNQLTGGEKEFTFYGTYHAKNQGQGKKLLRGFHSGEIVPGGGE